MTQHGVLWGTLQHLCNQPRSLNPQSMLSCCNRPSINWSEIWGSSSAGYLASTAERKVFLFDPHDCFTHTRLASVKDSGPHGNRSPIHRSSINRFPDRERKKEKEWEDNTQNWRSATVCSKHLHIYYISTCHFFLPPFGSSANDSPANLTQMRYFLAVLTL